LWKVCITILQFIFQEESLKGFIFQWEARGLILIKHPEKWEARGLTLIKYPEGDKILPRPRHCLWVTQRIECQIRNQQPRKPPNTEFYGNLWNFQNFMSAIWEICHFEKVIANWDRQKKYFLNLQPYRSPLIIVRIESQNSIDPKKITKRKFQIFEYFLQIRRHIGFPI